MYLQPHEVHLWTVDLALTAEAEQAKFALLSKDEQARALRFHLPLHKQRFIAARSTLREILSFYLATPASHIRFVYDTHKKPAIAFPEDTALCFNLSHSANLAVYAITLNHDIGIDIEKVQKSYNSALAQRFFSSQEIDSLNLLSNEMRIRAFYKIWSRKEALLKATGKGLSISLRSFSVPLHDDLETVTFADHNWSLMPLVIEKEFESALATNQPIHLLSRWIIFNHNPQQHSILLSTA